MRLFARTLFLLTIPALLAAQPASSAPRAFPIAWLAGCWTLRAGARTIEEEWMRDKGGAMLGMSRTVNNGRMTETEFVILDQAGDSLRYHVRPGRQAETTFTARAPFGDEIIFENLEHDFPKRIGYKRVARDSVEAWIDGGVGAAGKRVTFPYHRQTCGAP